MLVGELAIAHLLTICDRKKAARAATAFDCKVILMTAWQWFGHDLDQN